MISGLGNERVSYRTRYLQFPSSMAGTVPSISKPTVHVIKIRFNNIFKDEKVLFGAISVLLSIVSLLVGLGLYSAYKSFTAPTTKNTVAMEELQSINNADSNVMNKSMFSAGSTGSQGGNYISYNNGGGIDPNTMLIASSNPTEAEENGKDKSVLTSKKAIIQLDEKVSVNPFLPFNEANKKKVVKKVNPNYLLPPATLGTGSDANLLLTKTSVSGIMYDAFSPSAIIKIKDVDYFVKKGDVIQGFQILAINRDTVVIKRGANIYDAKVGRILATLQPNTTGTSNLNNKFGGSKNISYKR